ncbi:MAG: hypothetical protein HW417_1380 [Steroidobacteraceae bacterium]|nr:hypothetical protein [Steroidobacteraceae bacterium]
MRTILIVVVAIALAGCAIQASNPQLKHDTVPPKRVMGLPPAKDPAASATVHVMRDSQIAGSAMNTVLTIDGEDAARIRDGEEVTFSLEPGEHLLGLKFTGNNPVSGGFTFGFHRPKRFNESATQFEAGKIYIFRIVSNANWEWELHRASK